MKRILFGAALSLTIVWSSATIAAFCGFYVGKADTKLFNQASQVVLVRDGDRTVMTMAMLTVPVWTRVSMVVGAALSSACARSMDAILSSRMNIAPAPIGAPTHLCRLRPTNSASRSAIESGTCPNE